MTTGDRPHELGGSAVHLTPEGGLFWPDRGVLVVSDLHFEKGSALASRGTLLPPYDTAATLARLVALVDRLGARCVVSLGDTFHDTAAGDRVGPADRAALLALARRTGIVWVLGNHDPDVPDWLPGDRCETLMLEGVLLRHEPGGPLDDGARVEVAGHLHPCVKVAGASRRRVRRRCYVGDGQRFVMPAFGAYAGGLNVRDSAFDALWEGPTPPVAYALGADAVHAIGLDRALPDGASQARVSP